MNSYKKNFLAIDLGASHGSIIIGIFKRNELILQEAYRFTHYIVERSGVKCWDWDFIENEIRKGLITACELTGNDKIESISCSSWAQDFGLLNKKEGLIYKPVSYRDDRTKDLPFKFSDIIRPLELFKRNGSAISQVTTLCQLYSMVQNEPEYLSEADKFLFIADLVHNSLSGEMVTDWTFASASQMLDLKTRKWDIDLIEKLGIPLRLLPEVIDNPRVIGNVIYSDIHPKLAGIPIIAGAGHDTALASSIIFPMHEKTVFISLGTWAMIGCCDDQINTNQIADLSITKLGVAWNKLGLFCSSVGLWLIQECVKIWINKGTHVTYKELAERAFNSHINSIIPPNDERFFSPEDMIEEILNYCHETDQVAPEYPEDFAKVIFDSLVLEFRNLIEKLKNVTGIRFEKIQVVGGGSKNKYICSKMAEFIGIPVIAGPAEATAIGNNILQARVLNLLENEAEANEVVNRSFPVLTYKT